MSDGAERADTAVLKNVRSLVHPRLSRAGRWRPCRHPAADALRHWRVAGGKLLVTLDSSLTPTCPGILEGSPSEPSAMRSFVLPLVILLAGCARPVPQPATPTPMAAGCPMMHGGAPQPMAGMAMATPSDSGAAHKCPCRMHAMAHPAGSPAPAGADSTHVRAGCPMCTSGQCPMQGADSPRSGPHSH